MKKFLASLMLTLALISPAWAQGVKITDLPTQSSPSANDLTVIVHNPSTTPVTQSTTLNNALKLSGWTRTGSTLGLTTSTDQITAGNKGVEFIESDSNPTCAAGNYNIYADLSETKLKKCVNGTASDIAPAISVPVTFAQGGTGLSSAADDTVLVSSSSAWVAKTVPNCTDTGGNHLNYTQSSNTFSCGTSGSGISGSGTDKHVTRWSGTSAVQDSTMTLLDDGEMSNTATKSTAGGANNFVGHTVITDFTGSGTQRTTVGFWAEATASTGSTITRQVGLYATAPAGGDYAAMVSHGPLIIDATTGAGLYLNGNSNYLANSVTGYASILNGIYGALIYPGLQIQGDLRLGTGSAASYNIALSTIAGDTTPINLANGVMTVAGKLRVGIPTAVVGGTIFDHYVNAGNTTTSETDLYNDSIAGQTLVANGDKITARYAGIFVSSATATRDVRVYFGTGGGSTLIFDSGAIITASASNWDVSVLVIRVSSSVVRCTTTMSATTALGQVYSQYTEVTGLNLNTNQEIKITGQAGGTGAATNDIVAKLGTGAYLPGS